MKYNRAFGASRPLAPLLLTALLAASPIFANSVIVGGYVPEKRSLTITPIQGAGPSVPGEAVEVAVIEIDNNLPNYELILDFSGSIGNGYDISEVRLEGAGGILGRGLIAPSGTPMEAGSTPGRFLWSPGRQETATIRYRVKVMVTYSRPVEDRAPLMVSMNFSY